MSETRRDKRLALRVVVGDAFEMGPLNPADLETGSDERAKGEEVGGGGAEDTLQRMQALWAMSGFILNILIFGET